MRPRSRSLLKDEFLKKWVMGMKASKLPEKEMTLLQRKNTIKLTADLAMASARNATTSWSCAVLADPNNKTLIDKLLDSAGSKRVQRFITSTTTSRRRRRRRRRGTTSSYIIGIRGKKKKVGTKAASCIAREMVKKRRKMLKKMVPGGEDMNEFDFVDEAIDYIVSLQAQVDVMRSVLLMQV